MNTFKHFLAGLFFFIATTASTVQSATLVQGNFWDWPDNDEWVSKFFGPETTRFPRFPRNIDIKETCDAIIITFEIPGVKREDVTINVEHFEGDTSQLIVSGKRHITKTEINKNEKHPSSRYKEEKSEFSKSFNLASNVDTDAISAEQENGILVITLPLKKPSELKKSVRSIKVGIKGVLKETATSVKNTSHQVLNTLAGKSPTIKHHKKDNTN